MKFLCLERYIEQQKSKINKKYMKRKLLLSIALGLIILVIALKYYTDYVSNSAVKDYEKKYVAEFNDTHLADIESKNNLTPKIKERLINKFDKELYDSIIKVGSYQNSLIYSIIVSNKWDYSEASLNVFMGLTGLNKENSSKDLPQIDFLDEETRQMALHYLEKASNKENPNAKYILGKYYLEGKYVPKNVTLGNSLLQEAKKLSGGILE